MARRPGWPCAVLLITGVIALMAGGLALYGRHAVLDADTFAARATATLAQDEVTDEIASRISTREIEDNPDLTMRRPIIEAAVADVVGGLRFREEFRAGLLALHGSLFGRDGPAITNTWGGDPRTTTLPLPGAGPELRAAVAARSPAAARELPREDPVLFALGGGALESELVRAAPAARELSALGPVAVLLGLAALVGAAWRAPTRRLGLRRAALGIALAGGMTVAVDPAVAAPIVLRLRS